MSNPIAFKPNKDFWAYADKVYNDVTTSRPWRHTIGRISCATRIPIYALAALFQVAKMAMKFLPAIPISIIARATGTKKMDSWTFKGIAKDGLMAINLFDRIGSSTIGVLTAPPKNYHSLWEALKKSANITVMGRHQNTSLSDLAFRTIKARVCYSKIIVSEKRIFDHSNWTSTEVFKFPPNLVDLRVKSA